MNTIPTIIAKTIIASFLLRYGCDYRMLLHMEHSASHIIDALGGTSAVAKDIEAPVSTVHSWRTIGIPRSRMAHLRMVARNKGVTLPEPEQAA